MIFKSIKKAFAWTVFLLLLLVLLISGGYVALRSPRVQTALTQYLARVLSEELHTEVSVGGVDIGFFNRLILEDLFVQDLKGDTLASLADLHLGLKYLSLDRQQLYFGNIRIDDLKFYLQKYEGEEGLNLQFLIDYFAAPKDTSSGKRWDFRFEEVELKNASFKLRNHNMEKKVVGIDYRDLDVRHINLLIDHVRIDVDTIFGNVVQLSCVENRGFELKHFQGKAKVSCKELQVDDLLIETARSHVDLDLHYTYERWADYLSFVDSVRMQYDLRRSEVNMQDVAFFAPGLTGLDENLRISGSVHGPVSALNGRNLNIWYGMHTNLQGNVDMDGLPNIQETFMFLDLKRLVTDARDLERVPLPPFSEKKRLSLPPNVAYLGLMEFKGSFSGFINDFVAYGKLRTDIGELQTDLSLKQDSVSGIIAYSGGLRSVGFDLGVFLETTKFGKVTLDADVVGKGLTKEEINAKLVGKIQSARFMDYDYRNIVVNGTFAKSKFNGDLAIAEENVDLTFNGAIDLSGTLPEFVFHSEINHANLFELHLLRERENATVSGILDVNFRGNDIDNIIGQISISKARYQQQNDSTYLVNSVELTVSEDSASKHLRLRSDVADANFSGKFHFKNIPKAINNLVRKHLPSYASKDFEYLKPNEGLEFDFDVKLKNMGLVTYLFAPGIEFSDGSSFTGSYSSSQNQVFLRGNVSELKLKTVELTNVQIEAENPGSEFHLGLFADKVSLTDSIFLAAFEVSSFTFNDSLGLVVKWDNRTKVRNKAFIQGVASFPRDQQVSFHLKPSQITIADLQWSLDPRNLVTIDSSTFAFTDFKFYNAAQTIGLNGLISKDPNAKLNVQLSGFELKNLNLITSRSGINLGGRVSGKAQLSGLYDQLFFTNQLNVDSLVINNVEIGSGELNNTWIPSTRSVQVFGLLKRGDNTGLSIVGEFLPGEDRKENFNIRAMVDQLPLSIFDTYISKVLTDVKGTAKANLTLKGRMKEPDLSGYVVLQKADVLFTYLNTRFHINDTVQVKKDGFYFQDVRVKDERDSEARINGWVKHTNFKKFHFDANLVTSDFMALNTNSAMNSLYYGKAYGTGIVKFVGDPKNMHLDVAMKTERGTRFFIPLFGARSVNETDFITFVKPKVADEPVQFEHEYSFKFQNLTLDMDVEVTSDAEVQLIFDPKVGDILKGRGDGDLRISLDRTGNFKMFGEYYIQKGEYLFTLQNIINKKFLLEQGGTINWTGSPYDALVNIQASYGVRTSLYDLMYPDTSEIYRRRIQVDCLLKLTDNLMNPNITFDIDLPNSDEGTRTEVRNRIGVGNDQEMNRQVFGLLVLNRFFPTEAQGSVLTQTGGFFSSSTTEMISNQLSNWLSKISNDFDVGVNYRPGDDITGDELGVALSTQLFNNRLIVDGNVGVANTQSSSSNIVGDVNIEYKITADGRFRVRAFNKSNDINSLTNNAPFTQGVGVSYQKEFNRLGDLFRKRVREARKEEEPQLP